MPNNRSQNVRYNYHVLVAVSLQLISTPIQVIGLTGGIATGKSSVSALLKTHKVPIVDADVLARHVVLPGTPGLKKIVEYFGDEVLLPDGALDRKKLGTIIFNDEVKRKKLNSIVHPAVRRAMVWKMMDAWISGEKYCIMDIPLLIEGGLWKWMGKVIVVYWYVTLYQANHPSLDPSFTKST